VDLGLWVLGAGSRADLRRVEGRETGSRAGVDVATGATLRLETTGGATMELDLTTDGAGPERTRLTVEGAGNRAHILAGEDDPTAAALVFAGPRADALRDLTARSGGAQGPPLLVPYIHAALRAAWGDGPSPGLLGVADVALAHEIIFDVTAQSPGAR
jgi:hypothetical protein